MSMTLADYMADDDPHGIKAKKAAEQQAKKDWRYWQQRRKENRVREERKKSVMIPYNAAWGMKKKRRITADAVESFIDKAKGLPPASERRKPDYLSAVGLELFKKAHEPEYVFMNHPLADCWPDGSPDFPETTNWIQRITADDLVGRALPGDGVNLEDSTDWKMNKQTYIRLVIATAKESAKQHQDTITIWAQHEIEYWMPRSDDEFAGTVYASKLADPKPLSRRDFASLFGYPIYYLLRRKQLSRGFADIYDEFIECLPRARYGSRDKWLKEHGAG
jgi:hypothetical protein